MGSGKEASSSLLSSSLLTENNQGPLLAEVKVGLDGLVVESPCETNEGFWEEDSDWPLYKAGDCPLIWHTGNQCMENGRPDTLYQRLRYKQPRCPAPKLNGNTLCSLVANRSVAFVGDSLTENMFESFICLLHRFHGSPEPVSVGQQERVLRWPACNATVAFYWSAYLANLSLTVPGEHSKGGQLDLSHVDMHWGRHVAEHDTFVINTAHWWSPQHLWLGGIPLSPCSCPSHSLFPPISPCPREASPSLLVPAHLITSPRLSSHLSPCVCHSLSLPLPIPHSPLVVAPAPLARMHPLLSLLLLISFPFPVLSPSPSTYPTAHWWSPQPLWLGGIPFSPPYSSFAFPTSLLSAYLTALNTALSAFSVSLPMSPSLSTYPTAHWWSPQRLWLGGIPLSPCSCPTHYLSPSLSPCPSHSPLVVTAAPLARRHPLLSSLLLLRLPNLPPLCLSHRS
ncbi:unnamed protein product [Closterium sp. NIES-54]